MTPRTPTLASALQHALVAAMTITYLAAAATQIHRDNLPLAATNLLIALALTLILQAGVNEHGRIMANYGVRQHIKRTRREHDCAWCGESIPTKAAAIAHRGAINGETFQIHHHPECDHAITQWYLENSNETTTDLPLPKQGSMQRGSPHPRN